MSQGVDYSHSRPDPSCLYANGKRFAVRYVGTPTSGKNLTVAEAGRLRDAGLDLVAVYETTADFMLQGRARGVRAAEEATGDARKYGYPTGRPIYYALDVDPRPFTAAQWGAVNAFLDGAASVTGRGGVGVYGAWLAMEQLVPENAAFGWQTYAWSSGKVSAQAHLYQYRNGMNLCGGQLDLCRSLKADFGQWTTTPEEIPLQLDTDDQKFIRDQVQRLGDKLMLGIGNPLFPPETYGNAATLPKILTAVGQVGDVDEQAIANAILAGLNPTQIAEMIATAVGPQLAEDVADELHARLAG